MSEARYCCEVAADLSISPAGSAVQVDCWLLIEYLDAWSAKAVEESSLNQQALTRLGQEFADLGLKLRVQLIKQADSSRDRSRLLFADGRDDHISLLQHTQAGEADVEHLTAAMLLDEAPNSWQSVQEEIYLICTNGQRDVCCARVGRPLYSELHTQFGSRVWQTSHVGGHRYAPNLLCLPSGFMYGFVEPDIGVDLVRAHDRGHLTVPLLRGRSHYPSAMQAGEVHARLSHGITERSALHCVAQTGDGSRYSVSYAGDHSGTVALEADKMVLPASECSDKVATVVQYRLASS